MFLQARYLVITPAIEARVPGPRHVPPGGRHIHIDIAACMVLTLTLTLTLTLALTP